MDSAFLSNYRLLGRYNSWFNQRLYDACEPLGDEKCKSDRGAFFGSIHNSLNRLVRGDRLPVAHHALQQHQQDQP